MEKQPAIKFFEIDRVIGNYPYVDGVPAKLGLMVGRYVIFGFTDVRNSSGKLDILKMCLSPNNSKYAIGGLEK